MTQSIVRGAFAAAIAALLVGCGGGGGGGGGGPVSPPPPPPPATPSVVGESPSGGTVDSNSTYSGNFRGPLGLLSLDAAGVATVEVGAKTTAGSPVDVLVAASGDGANDQPTLTLTLRGDTAVFDFDQAATTTLASGGLEQRSLTTTAGGATWNASLLDFNFNGRTREYSRVLVFQRATTPGDPPLSGGALSYGADEVTVPSTGSATFETGIAGYYNANGPSGDLEEFIGRTTTSVNFTSKTMTASFADVDFVSGANMVETASGGADFGVTMNATITGDDFAGTMVTTGTTAMAGTVQGDFYGPHNATPTEIGGAFAMQGAGGAAFGGLQGVCTCITGTSP